MAGFIISFWDLNHSRINENTADEKTRLNRYYEQLKQSIVENENYAEALLQTANAVYTVDLTNDKLENVYYHEAAFKIENDHTDTTVLIAIIAINGVGM